MASDMEKPEESRGRDKVMKEPQRPSNVMSFLIQTAPVSHILVKRCTECPRGISVHVETRGGRQTSLHVAPDSVLVTYDRCYDRTL